MKKLAREAGDLILGLYNSPDGEIHSSIKTDDSPVTKADIIANRHIVENLERKFPSYAILSEESADDLSRIENSFCFLVDPLDGTKEFIRRNGEFTVNIALASNRKIIAGVIYAPAIDELYYAAKKEGAFLETTSTRKKISVSDRNQKLRIAVSRSHRSPEEDELIKKLNITEVIEAGSSLKGCLVARGDAEIYYRHGRTMEWDTAAMQIIIEEAGGEMYYIDGSSILYNKTIPKNRSFIAKNRSSVIDL